MIPDTDAARRAAEEIRQQLILGDAEVWLADGSPDAEEFVRLVATAIAQARAEERERIRAWPHVCAMEACCIENGLHALHPAPERGPTEVQ